MKNGRILAASLLSMLALAGTAWSQEAFSTSVNAVLKTTGGAAAKMKTAGVQAPSSLAIDPSTPPAPPYTLPQITKILDRCFSEMADLVSAEAILVKNTVKMKARTGDGQPLKGDSSRRIFVSQGDLMGALSNCESGYVGNASIREDGTFSFHKGIYCPPAETASDDTYDLSVAGALPLVAYDVGARKAAYDPRTGNAMPDKDLFSELLLIGPSTPALDPSRAALTNTSTLQPTTMTLDVAAYTSCLNKSLQFKNVSLTR